MGWDYESENDKPSEDDVKKKQVMCKQINLSKLKLNKVYIKPSVPYDLQKIKENKKTVPMPLKDNVETKESINTPPNTPEYKSSQKQKHHNKTYLNLLKNI
jgi:hypothetical protein